MFHIATQWLYTSINCSNDERRLHVWVRMSLQSLYNINNISVSVRKRNNGFRETEWRISTSSKKSIACKKVTFLKQPTKIVMKQFKLGKYRQIKLTASNSRNKLTTTEKSSINFALNIWKSSFQEAQKA